MHDVLAVSRRRDDPRRAARHRPAARRRRAGRRRPRLPRGPRGGRAGRRRPRRAGRRRADAHRRGRRPSSRRPATTTPTSRARASRPPACRGSTSGAWRCSASDVAQDPTPTGYRTVHMPIHMVGIVAMGLWLIDNCQLEDLADDVHPARPLGVPVRAGADPLPGRDRQPGQPARRLLTAPTPPMRIDTPLLVVGRGPAALVVAKVAAGLRPAVPARRPRGRSATTTPVALDDAAVAVLDPPRRARRAAPVPDRRRRRRRSRRATSRRSSSTTASPT